MHFVVISKDKPGMTEVRMRTRPAHLEYMVTTVAGARNIFGVPLGTDDGQTMIGTFYMVEAPDRAAAEAFAKGDPYARAGIFASTEVIAVHPAGAKLIGRIPPREG